MPHTASNSFIGTKKRHPDGCSKFQVIKKRPKNTLSLRASAHTGVAIRSPKPSPERRRWLEEPDEVAVKFLGSPVPCMSLRTSPQTGMAIRSPRPPWLPLWGSCHEVTERVTTPSPPLRGTSPIGRGKPLIRLALAGNARDTFPQGKAWGRIATPVCGLVRNDSFYFRAMQSQRGTRMGAS